VLAEAYLRQGQLAEALSTFDQAIRLQTLSSLYLGRAETKRRLGQLASAVQDCDLVINRESKPDAKAYVIRGQCNLLLGSYDSALTDIDHSLVINPNDAFARSLRARCKTAIRNHRMEEDGGGNQTAESLNRDVQLHPGDAKALLRRGKFYFKGLESKRAIADYTRAIEIDPKIEKGTF
jgi:tetratricopeptide (TPR) repeat protein